MRDVEEGDFGATPRLHPLSSVSSNDARVVTAFVPIR
jgi:hypothetical protein